MLPKGIAEAIADLYKATLSLASSTTTEYKRALRNLNQMATYRGLQDIDQITVEEVHGLRSSQTIDTVPWAKYLQILRQFFHFCITRSWIGENPAADIMRPENIQQDEVEPYSREAFTKILMVFESIGRTSYKPLRDGTRRVMFSKDAGNGWFVFRFTICVSKRHAPRVWYCDSNHRKCGSASVCVIP